MKNFTLVLLALTFFSCGSLDWSFFKKKKKTNKDQEVAKEFNLSEDVIVKFESKKVEDEELVQNQIVKPVSSVKIPYRPKKKSKKKIVKAKAIKKTLPKNYPARLKKASAKALKAWNLLDVEMFKRSGERMFFEANYAGITMGKIVITNDGAQNFPSGLAYVLKGDVKTSPFYSYLYEMEGTISSHFLVDQRVPVKFRFDQVEHKKIRNDLQYYDSEERKTISLYKKTYKGKTSKSHKEAMIPFPYLDSFSIINFIRGLRLKKGDRYQVPLVHKAKILNFNLRVLGSEKVSVPFGKKKAIKVQADSNFSGETLKSGKLTFWIADDETRALLQVKVKINLGSVYLKLVEYKR